MRFTLFELLFGSSGLLAAVQEAWEKQPSPYHSMVEFVTEIKERIECVQPIVQEYMHATQEEQRCVYNWPTQPHKFHPGDRILFLVPDASCKFLAHCQGPYTVEERVGPVNYRLQQPGKRSETQLYYIN